MNKLELIKELRSRTQASMADCKQAIESSNGDIEVAIDILRKNGIIKAAKKGDRDACEGIVCAISNGLFGFIITVQTETDFVTRNDIFQIFVQEVVDCVCAQQPKTMQDVLSLQLNSGVNVEQKCQEMTAIIGEKICIGFYEAITGDDDHYVGVYIHGKLPNSDICGVSAALVVLSGVGIGVLKLPEIVELTKKIAMHIVAANPLAINIDQIPQNIIDREMAIIQEKISAENKAPEIKEKMLAASVRKWHEETLLTKQTSIFDSKITITEMVNSVGNNIATTLNINRFLRVSIGKS